MPKLIYVLPALALVACGDVEKDPSLDGAKPALAVYADAVEKGYFESLEGAQALHTALVAFTDAPSAELLEAAKTAWIAARVSYRQTEAWRFYGGPIDDPADEREGQINAWPLAEASIDYVVIKNAQNEDETVYDGMVNKPADFPAIDKQVLIDANFANGEDDVKTGYHAIEFLLWGQDRSDTGPGARPYTDYVVGEGATAPNGERRAAYLLAVSELLVEDLTHVHSRWTDKGDYRATFLAQAPADALTKVFTGVGTLAASELSQERMLTAWENKAQEDEHSCFSDTTKEDIWGNAKSLQNTYLGVFGDFDGEGFDVLVATVNPALDTKMKTALSDALAAIEAIPGTFDNAILGLDTDDGRVKVLAAVRAVQDVGDVTEEIAATLGFDINTALPE